MPSTAIYPSDFNLFLFVILGTIVPIGRVLFTIVVPFHLRVELSFPSDCSFKVKVVPILKVFCSLLKFQKGISVPLLSGSVLIVCFLSYFQGTFVAIALFLFQSVGSF